jgi:uncharacterized repeat protein (TIGR02543 family)
MTDTLTTAGKVIYVLKAEKSNKIKAGAKCYEVSTKAEENTLTAIGAKSTTADVYLYVCDKQFEADGTVDANVVIKAQAAKKITGVIDYTQADNLASTTVLSIKATDKNKKEIAGATAIWYDETLTTPVWANADTLTGEKLVKMMEAGTKAIKVKMLGDEKTRTSKEIKVKIAKQTKAPTVKIDVKKDTISIKNGMDFGVFTKSSSGEYTLVGGWHTVLPLLKTAATKTLADSIVDTTAYAPLGKKETNATKTITDGNGKVSYTQLKVKALDLNTYKAVIGSGSGVDLTDDSVEYYVGVRSSATEKKPASVVTYFKYSDKLDAPIVYTQDKVKGQYLVASGKEFAKKGFVLGTIANYNGENGTEGFDDSFKLKTSNSGADTAAASYEYTIVKYADLGDLSSGSGSNINWSSVSWKKLDPAKTKITGKLKSKYLNTAGTKVEATLKAGTLSASGATTDVPADCTTVLLVRRAGVKGKTADDAVLASQIQILYVVKNGSDYEIYSTKDIGEEAVKYTVEFYKWSLSGESTSGEYTWIKDDSLTITGWGRHDSNSGEEIVAFPEITNADFFALNDSNELSNDKAPAIADGANKGKYEIHITGMSGEETTKFAIREYATIKVVAAASGEGTTDTKEIGAVKAGKVSSVSGDKLVDGTSVTAYVGSSISGVATLTYAVPTGYISSGSGSIVASGTGYKDAKIENNGTITVTVNTADTVEVRINYPVVKQYTVKFDFNGKTGSIDDLKTNPEGKVTKPDNPTVDGFTFGGWFTDKDCTNEADFNKAFTADTTLYAKWTEAAQSP